MPTDPPVDGPIPTDEVFVGTLPPIGSTSTTTVAACAAFTLLGIEFESGSEALTAASLALVDDLAAKLRETPEPWNLRIVGHTDSRTFNGPGGNQGLSERRAAAVAEAVQATGVIPSATVTTSTGVANRHPVAVGDDPTALAANRRVEVIVICT